MDAATRRCSCERGEVVTDPVVLALFDGDAWGVGVSFPFECEVSAALAKVRAEALEEAIRETGLCGCAVRIRALIPAAPREPQEGQDLGALARGQTEAWPEGWCDKRSVPPWCFRDRDHTGPCMGSKACAIAPSVQPAAGSPAVTLGALRAASEEE